MFLCSFHCIQGHLILSMTLVWSIKIFWRFPDVSPFLVIQCHSAIEIQRENMISKDCSISLVLVCLILFNTYKLVLSLLQRESNVLLPGDVFINYDPLELCSLFGFHVRWLRYCVFPLSYSASLTTTVVVDLFAFINAYAGSSSLWSWLVYVHFAMVLWLV